MIKQFYKKLTQSVINIENMYRVLFYLSVSVFIGIGFLIRLDTFSHASVYSYQADDSYQADVSRDFLIGYNIVTYGETPLTGPDGYFGPNSNSPLYYYFIASIIFVIGSNIFLLGVVNLVLQSISLALVYFFVKNFFDKKIAVTSTILFTLLNIFIEQSLYIWQPHIMQLFLLVSLFYLSKNYVTGKQIYLYISIFLFSFTTVIHNSALALVPIYGIAVFALLYKYKLSVQKYIISFAIFGFTEFILYVPVFYFYFLQNVQFSLVHGIKPSLDIIPNVVIRSVQFIGYFFNVDYKVYSIGILLLLFALTVGFFFNVKNIERKITFIILILAFVSVMFAIGLVIDIPKSIEFPVRYATPVYIIFTVLISVLICWISKIKHIGAVLYFFIIIILIFSTGSINKQSPHTLKVILLNPVEHFVSQSFFDITYRQEASQVIKAINKYSLDANFDFITFDKKIDSLVDWSNEIMWVPIVLNMKSKQIVIDDNTYRGYRSVHDPEYKFIQCRLMSVLECKEVIDDYFSKYKIVQNVLSSDFGSIVLIKVKNDK